MQDMNDNRSRSPEHGSNDTQHCGHPSYRGPQFNDTGAVTSHTILISADLPASNSEIHSIIPCGVSAPLVSVSTSSSSFVNHRARIPFATVTSLEEFILPPPRFVLLPSMPTIGSSFGSRRTILTRSSDDTGIWSRMIRRGSEAARVFLTVIRCVYAVVSVRVVSSPPCDLTILERG